VIGRTGAVALSAHRLALLDRAESIGVDRRRTGAVGVLADVGRGLPFRADLAQDGAAVAAQGGRTRRLPRATGTGDWSR
jgi:hypothetical protein